MIISCIFDKDKNNEAEPSPPTDHNKELLNKPPKYVFPSREDKLAEALKVMFHNAEGQFKSSGHEGV